LTHILPNNSAKARDPQHPSPTHLIYEQPFAREHGLAEALTLIVLHHPLRGHDERVLADTPQLGTVETESGDVAGRGWREEDLAGAGVGRGGHLAASDEFLHREFDGAFESDGGGHGDHDAWNESVSLGRRLPARHGTRVSPARHGRA